MPNDINFSLAPFNRLTSEQQEIITKNTDIAYFRVGDTIIHEGQTSDNLFIIMKGSVEERSDTSGEIYAHYTHDDIFDVRSQFEHQVKHSYIALEDTLCHLLPTQLFLKLYNENQAFSDYFNSSLAKRKALLTQAHQQQNLAEFILTKVDDETTQQCLIVDRNTPLQQVTQLLKDNNMDALFVELNQYDTRHQEAQNN